MLEFMRKSANTIFIKAFLGLLILSFAAWGIGDIFRGRAASTAVATVGENEISAAEFRSEFARELQRMSQVFGQQISREQGKSMGIDNLLVSRLVQTALVNEGANDLRLLVPDSAVVGVIKQNPEFFNDAGVFDRNLYISILGQSGFTEERYVARVRTNMARQQYLSPIRTGAVMPKGMVRALYAHAAEQRSADVIRINHPAIPNVPVPNMDQLSKYHQDNAANFMAPEYRKITAVVLQAADLAKSISVSEEDIQTAYDEREAEFLTPEKRKLRQILVKEEAKANTALDLLKTGKSLEDTAIEVGANPAMMDIGDFTSADAANLSPDIATAVFAMAKGEYSAPLKSPLGWHVFEVQDITPVVVKPLTEVRDQLTKTVKLDRALTSLFDLSNQMEDLLGGGQTFEEAAASLGISPTVVGAVDARSKGLDGETLNIPYINSIVGEAFKLGDGQDSQMTESGDGQAFFVVRVDGITQPALRPLDTVTKEASDAWSAQKRSELATELAKTATERLKAGEDAMTIATSMGSLATTTKPFTRDGKGLEKNALPADVIAALFGLKSGEVTSAEGTGAHTVARLTSITPAIKDDSNAVYRAVADKALTDIQSDLMAQLSVALQAKHGVSINQNAVNEAY